MTDLLREELVELSVMRAITTGLPDFGFYPNGSTEGQAQNCVVREAFPTPDERQAELTITTLAFGFNIDDGGEPAELGSTLTKYAHTLVCWVFGVEPALARKMADSLKHISRRNLDSIPLLDFNEESEPIIDTMNVLKAQTRHQVNQSPRPWDRYVWTTSIVVRDVSYPMQSATSHHRREVRVEADQAVDRPHA